MVAAVLRLQLNAQRSPMERRCHPSYPFKFQMFEASLAWLVHLLGLTSTYIIGDDDKP
jgi:hypothetical protein